MVRMGESKMRKRTKCLMVTGVCLVALFLVFGYRSPRFTEPSSGSTVAELRRTIEMEHAAAMEADAKNKREIDKLKLQLAMQHETVEMPHQDPQSDAVPIVTVPDDHLDDKPSDRPAITLRTTARHQVEEISGDWYIMELGQVEETAGVWSGVRGYLGAPNKDNKIDSFEHRCDWTKWKKQSENEYVYTGIQFSKRDMEIVVAWYDEDIQWTEPYRDIVTLYRKGPHEKVDQLKVVSELSFVPNVGREAHTYLHHIVRQYGSKRIAKRTLFAQGQMSQSHTPLSIASYLDQSDSSVVCKINVRGTIYAGQPDGFGFLKHAGKWLAERVSGDMKADPDPFRIWWTKYVRKELPHIDNYEYSHGAIFAVSRIAILAQPLHYYTQLLDTVGGHKNPEAGHYLERSWRYIFSPPYISEMKPVVIGHLDPTKRLKIQAATGLRSGSFSTHNLHREGEIMIMRSDYKTVTSEGVKTTHQKEDQLQLGLLFVDMVPQDSMMSLTFTVGSRVSGDFSSKARLVACSLKNRGWTENRVSWRHFKQEANTVSKNSDIPKGAVCSVITIPADVHPGSTVCANNFVSVVRKDKQDDQFGYLNVMLFVLPAPMSNTEQAYISIYPSKSPLGPYVTSTSCE